jgi:hypothetical protein
LLNFILMVLWTYWMMESCKYMKICNHCLFINEETLVVSFYVTANVPCNLPHILCI